MEDPKFSGRDMGEEIKLIAKAVGAETWSYVADRAVFWVRRSADPRESADPTYLDPSGDFWINLVVTLRTRPTHQELEKIKALAAERVLEAAEERACRTAERGRNEV